MINYILLIFILLSNGIGFAVTENENAKIWEMIEQLATRKSSEEIGLLEIVEQSKILEELKNIKSVELEKGSEKDILSYPILVSVPVNEWDSFLMDSEGFIQENPMFLLRKMEKILLQILLLKQLVQCDRSGI